MENPKNEEGLTVRQEKYVAARLNGKPMQQCKVMAGYAPTQPSSAIERPGGVVWTAIRKALNKHGLNDNWIAQELKEGVERAKHSITRFNPKTGEAVEDPDLAAHERYLGRICKLKGYEREVNNGPQVAVQINNQFPGVENLAHGEAESIINAIRAEIVSRESADVLEANIRNEDAAPCINVDTVSGEQQEASGGGSES